MANIKKFLTILWRELRYHAELRAAVALVVIFSIAVVIFLSVDYAVGPGSSAEEKISETSSSVKTEDSSSIPSEPSEATVTSDSNGLICVHVAGHVKNPGIYFIPEGSRVADAIARAGPKPEANLDFLNLAMILSDGAKIYVPDNEEAKKSGWPLTNLSLGVSSGQSGSQTDRIRINLNTCTGKDLEAIPGIGEITAEKIIELREKKHGFKSVDELKEVQGIGEKKFEQIKPYVYVVN